MFGRRRPSSTRRARGSSSCRTSRDSVTVAALQKHASEVSELVRDGMAAMHGAMMSNGGGMMGRAMMGRTPGP